MQVPGHEITGLYGGRVRLRVCGILIHDDRILLVNHALYGAGESFWSPPGGGVEFGESAEKALAREFQEETGLVARVGKMLFVNEFISETFHAIELFFRIESVSGHVKIGFDPEMEAGRQIIAEVKYMSLDEILSLRDEQRHGIFSLTKSLATLNDIGPFISNASGSFK